MKKKKEALTKGEVGHTERQKVQIDSSASPEIEKKEEYGSQKGENLLEN